MQRQRKYPNRQADEYLTHDDWLRDYLGLGGPVRLKEEEPGDPSPWFLMPLLIPLVLWMIVLWPVDPKSPAVNQSSQVPAPSPSREGHGNSEN